MTFRPGTPEMAVLATLVLVGAIFVAVVTWFAREFACNESGGDCGSGLPLLIVAIAGLVPALGMLIASERKNGHPWRWFFVTALLYAIWGVSFAGWVRGGL